ncbi:hypothetical protein Taro_020431 [Colocasia esculenta]|uniref:Uncharacterized protein n=1 Tax=Colocasia esculenta TaxID=4460 RepID=A0A843UWC0_COLES|nr:hypothetical protein [Colocasia esculenta]
MRRKRIPEQGSILIWSNQALSEAKTVSLSSITLRQILDKVQKTRLRAQMSDPIQADVKKAEPRKEISDSTINQVRISRLKKGFRIKPLNRT